MFKLIAIVGFVVFVGAATLCKPEFFAGNGFLNELVSHELLALLSVILTITFASVSNIHLSINRIIARAFSDNVKQGLLSAAPVRRELNENAWTLFWSFVACIIFLMIKGWFPKEIYVVSAINGLGLGVLLLNALVLYDIYRVVFVLVTSEFALSEERVSSHDGPLSGG